MPANTDHNGENLAEASHAEASHEAMQSLGEALLGPLISSLQSAGLIPPLVQSRRYVQCDKGKHPCGVPIQSVTQAGPSQCPPHGDGHYPCVNDTLFREISSSWKQQPVGHSTSFSEA